MCSAVVLFLVSAFALGAYAQAPPNAVAFSDFSGIAGTWTGTCTQTAYVNPEIPRAASCAFSLNEYFSYPFTVTFQGTNGYSVTYGTFNTTGQNKTFTSKRVKMNGPGFTTLSRTGSVATGGILDISNGGSRCVTVSWSDSSPSSTFLATLTKGVGGYGTYLEEGVRTFSTSAVTGAVNTCPNDTNLPFECNQGSYPSSTIPTKYSYMCYAIIKASIFN